MRASLFSLACLAASSAASAQTPPTAPDWMSGYWLSCENNTQIAENWFGASSGAMLGTNLTQGEQGSFEFLRVAANGRGGLSYYSMPNAAPVTEFTMITHENRRVVFENPAHDFPQRILYWREGNTLHARIEGEVDGRTQAMDWTFRRARADSNCRR